jgi:hypothetical protein
MDEQFCHALHFVLSRCIIAIGTFFEPKRSKSTTRYGSPCCRLRLSRHLILLAVVGLGVLVAVFKIVNVEKAVKLIGVI